MDDLSLSEIRAPIKLINREERFRDCRVSLENIYAIQNKLKKARLSKNG
jgi:hypothetical protein